MLAKITNIHIKLSGKIYGNIYNDNLKFKIIFSNASLTEVIEVKVTISFVTRRAHYWEIQHGLKQERHYCSYLK